jgi:replicative DNA helicase
MTDFPSSNTDSSAPLSPSGVAVEPHNREAEEALLGAVLINPEAFFEVATLLSTSDL